MRTEDGASADGRVVALNWSKDLPDRGPDDPAIGPARRVDIAGRCASCWGQSLLLLDGNDRHLGLTCRVCEQRVDEDHVELELKRMQLEAERNLPGVRVGLAADYDERARFVLKLLPEMDRNKVDFDKRVANAKARPSSRKKGGRLLTRRDFEEPGTPGHFFFQASALVAGLGALPRNISAISLDDFDLETLPNDVEVKAGDIPGRVNVTGSAPMKESASGQMTDRMGIATMAGFGAAFACEVVMKAILLTRLDEAAKSHDLLVLYESLPTDCRKRLQGDFPRIVDIMTKYRHTFGRWRYFEPGAGQDTLSVLVNLDQIRGLEKAARVLLDDGAIAGLGYDLDVDYDYDQSSSFYLKGDRTVAAVPDSDVGSTKVSMQLGGHESAVAWDEILPLASTLSTQSEDAE